MKNIQLLIAIFTLCFSNTIFAQATANFNASVTVIQPIGITTTSNLNFANVDASKGGELTLSPDTSISSTGGVALVDGGNASAASFEVTGAPGYTFDVTLPADNYVLTNGSETIEINDFTSSIEGETALVDGTYVFKVGATLNLNPNQSPGYYVSEGGLTVAVNYN